MDRRRFLRTATAAGVGAGLAPGRLLGDDGQRKNPNVIFVFADQMRAQVLGCYGNAQVPTPNLDAMAKRGVVFDHAISTWPVCSPYRAMLMTGRYPMTNGTVANDTAVRGDLPTIARTLKSHGYATGYVGKWHLEWERTPFVPKERRLGFDYWAVRSCAHQYLDSFYCGDTDEEIPLPGYEPVAQTDLAVNYIKANKDRPFCLFLSWGPPHDPYEKVPDEYKAQFPVDRIRFHENVSERAMVDQLLETDPSKVGDRAAKRRRAKRNILDSDELLRSKYIQGYYAHSKALDDCMGRILRTLSDAGIADDTILVFSSDHGDMLGSHRMGSKQMPFEESLRIPFLVQYPRKIPQGTRTDALLSPIDIMPTLLALAGVPCPDVDGIDLSEAACGVRSDRQDAVLIMKLLPGGNPWLCNGVTPWRGVRTKQHTYARLLDRGPWVLFDNHDDPGQIHNRVSDPTYAEIRKRLDTQTTRLLAAAADPNDTGEILSFRHSRMPKDRRKAKRRKRTKA